MPAGILKRIGGRPFVRDAVGMSCAQVLCFDDMVLKVQPQSAASETEHQMMRWLSGCVPVPEVLAWERQDGMDYLLMRRIEGEMLCAPAHMANPAQVVRLLAEGLQMLWRVDAAHCPCDQSLENRLKAAQLRVENHLCSTQGAEPGTYGPEGFASPAHLLDWLWKNKPGEQRVLTHGDYCLPNLFAKAGRLTGMIDLGQCGAADPYRDIALCYRSLRRNYAGEYGGAQYPGFDADILFKQLGIDPDRDLIRYYILLDELF